MSIDLTSVMILLTLQLLVLGWRIAREIDGRERHPFPFVPVPDNVNVASMLAVVAFCVVAPLTGTGLRLYSVEVLGRAVFGAATVLIVAHPLVVAAHYRLWAGSRDSTAMIPYCTRAEAITQLIALVAAGATFMWVLQAANQPQIILSAG